ncbi:hypothetical protein MKQ70_32240 [Chitinophaga sedimenti]|uniref:hypothetical protein n=1 Tax=Chitinophaga sedimenti TaxID=2033606 RepID=UPI002005A014|nr:hypothetical protein [Chitinophaga sedimenti]MCK7559388.1 hypothetical protein [Chitinophaga sedimenti]
MSSKEFIKRKLYDGKVMEFVDLFEENGLSPEIVSALSGVADWEIRRLITKPRDTTYHVVRTIADYLNVDPFTVSAMITRQEIRSEFTYYKDKGWWPEAETVIAGKVLPDLSGGVRWN